MLETLTSGSDSPLDLVHLARQCLGDQALEAELVGMFRRQAPALMAQLFGSPSLPLGSKARIAHTLPGSALAVGAGRFANTACRIEEMARGNSDPRSQA